MSYICSYVLHNYTIIEGRKKEYRLGYEQPSKQHDMYSLPWTVQILRATHFRRRGICSSSDEKYSVKKFEMEKKKL